LADEATATTSLVLVEIARGKVITSSITNEAVKDLDLKVGGAAIVVVKASDVIIGATATTASFHRAFERASHHAIGVPITGRKMVVADSTARVNRIGDQMSP
jgi:molybdopterin-binding protein